MPLSLPAASNGARDQACGADAQTNVKNHYQRARQHEGEIFGESLAGPRLFGFQRAVAKPDRKRQCREKSGPEPAT